MSSHRDLLYILFSWQKCVQENLALQLNYQTDLKSLNIPLTNWTDPSRTWHIGSGMPLFRLLSEFRLFPTSDFFFRLFFVLLLLLFVCCCLQSQACYISASVPIRIVLLQYGSSGQFWLRKSSSFKGASPPWTPTGALPLDPAGGSAPRPPGISYFLEQSQWHPWVLSLQTSENNIKPT